MESLGDRRGELQEMQPDGKGGCDRSSHPQSRSYGVPPHFLSQTSGTGIMSFASDGFGPRISEDVGSRKNGALISNAGQGCRLCALEPAGTRSHDGEAK